MTIEDRLRESLHGRAQQVVPAEPEWERITDRLPARHRVWPRVVAATGLAAAAAVLGFVLLRSHHSPTNVHTGGSAPTVAPTTTVVPTTIAAVVEPPVPPGFTPQSATRTSLVSEWVLGTTPCTSGRCSAIVHSRDGGATWHAVTTSGLPGPSAVASIRFADASNGWLFGPDLWGTHDGGATWHKVTLVGGEVRSLEAASGTSYALGSGASGPAQLWIASTGGDNWTRVGAPVFRYGSTLALRGPVGYGLGDDGAVFSFSVTGVERRGSPCAGPSGLAQVTDTRVAVVCVLGAAAGSSEKRLTVSDDGGRTWSTAGTPPFGGQPMAVAAATASTYVVAAASGDSRLYRSADGGRTWTTPYVDNTTGGAPWLDLGFTDALHGFVVSGGNHSKLLTTSDGGATWVVAHF
jgi:photosystem II stability/assembly factor-like uncharacterized protein